MQAIFLHVKEFASYKILLLRIRSCLDYIVAWTILLHRLLFCMGYIVTLVYRILLLRMPVVHCSHVTRREESVAVGTLLHGLQCYFSCIGVSGGCDPRGLTGHYLY